MGPGDPPAALPGHDAQPIEALVPLVYDELRRIAARDLAHDRQHGAIDPTSLVNEACLKLLDLRRIDWKDRTHVLAVGARVLRQVLVDRARAERAAKRGGGWVQVAFDDRADHGGSHGVDVIDLHDAIERLSALDPRQARAVELRFFGGLTLDEIAGVLDVSPRTAGEDLRMARAWLMVELAPS